MLGRASGFYSTGRDIKYKIEKYYCIIKWEIVRDTRHAAAASVAAIRREGMAVKVNSASAEPLYKPG